MDNKETAEHIRKWLTISHGPFAWPTDGCGYDQHVKFVRYRNKYWNGDGDFKKFLLDYADMIEKEEP